MSWFSNDNAEFIEQYRRLASSRETYRKRLERTEHSIEDAHEEARKRGLILPVDVGLEEDGLHAGP